MKDSRAAETRHAELYRASSFAKPFFTKNFLAFQGRWRKTDFLTCLRRNGAGGRNLASANRPVSQFPLLRKDTMMTLRCALAWVVAAAIFTAAGSTTLAQVSDEEAVAIATEAYIYGYPLVTMEMTRRVMTNVA